MNPIVVSFFAAFLATALLIPNAANAQDASVAKSMQALKDQTAELGAPKIEGKEVVAGKDAPGLYFGSTKMNNLAVVDKVAKEGGEGMAATLFVKGEGDEYIRVATTLPKALGSELGGPALDSINAGKPYYGEAPVIGVPCISGYEPIKDASSPRTEERIGAS
jgi:hypothetical protein